MSDKTKDVKVFLAMSNDRTVVSFTLYSDHEIDYDTLAEALQQHVDVIRKDRSQAV